MKKDHVVLRRLFMEDIVLQFGERQAKEFFGNVFVKWLDPANTNTLISFFLIDKSRRYFGGSRNSNVRVGNKRKDWRGAKAIPGDLCWDWNFRTCSRNWDCPHKHQCCGCNRRNHGLRFCPVLEEKFGMKRVYKGKNEKYKRNDNNDNSNYSSYNTGAPQRPRTQGTFTNMQFPQTASVAGGGGATNTAGFTALPPGMQLTMVPMVTPVNDNNNNNNGKGGKKRK